MSIDQNDGVTFAEDLAYGHVYFVVAKRSHERLDVEFEGFEVNGELRPLGRPRPLPADQGYWIDIGPFRVGEEIEVNWQIRTGIDVPYGETLFGHCPNGKLTKLVRVERRQLESFQTYIGTFKVTPEKP